jgi:hypothetical protein
MPFQVMSSMDELIQANDRLRNLIYTVEKLAFVEDVSNIEPYAVTSLGRRLAPTSIPPALVRFNTESGPIEVMPSLFQVPFPTLENLKMSLLNSNISANRLTSAARAPSSSSKRNGSAHSQPPTRVIDKPEIQGITPLQDDEYADDF